MKLILNNYIASLKEDKELDSLIQDILRQFDIEIVFQPRRGRQYGVDIYAVGKDPIDEMKKVFLVTVKKGNLDRNNWQGSNQAIRQTLEEIVDVFIRNNLLPEHKNLPIKIIVAHNGINDPAIQQNFVAFADKNPNFEFVVWQLETLVNFTHEKLLNENVLSDESRKLFRKALINVDDPGYDLRHYRELIDNMISDLEYSKDATLKNVRLLRKISLVNAITVSYCEDESDLRLAVKVSELTVCRLADFIVGNEENLNENYVAEFVAALFERANLLGRYIDKIKPVCKIKDGFSRYSFDSISYAHNVYEHLGMISLAGLEVLQLADLVKGKDTRLYEVLMDCALSYSESVVEMFNNNGVVFSPRLDSYCIEINLAFLLLHKLEQHENVRALIVQYNNQIIHAKLFSNIFPDFQNDFEKVYEREFFFDKRAEEKRTSSTILTTLIEWTLILNDSKGYKSFVDVGKQLFEKVDLILWFPDKETEKSMFKSNVMSDTGYNLTHIEPGEDFEAFRNLTIQEHEYNSPETNFYFYREGLWAIALISMRHFRNYVFPSYMRSLMPSVAAVHTEDFSTT
jgi:hypothetical protein